MRSNNIRKKVIVVSLAAALTGALGITAYAAFSGIGARTPEPSETISNTFTKKYHDGVFDAEAPTESEEETVASDENEIIKRSAILNDPTVLSIDGDTVTYTNMTKVLSFVGAEESQEITLKELYHPEGYEFFPCDPSTVQAVKILGTDSEGNDIEQPFNITVDYTSHLGDHGCMLFFDEFDQESQEQDGEFFIYKLSGIDRASGETPRGVAYYVMFNPADGYIITIASESLDLCEKLRDGLKIEKTGKAPSDEFYDPDSPNVYMTNGIG